MENCDTTAERLEMAAVMQVNHTQTADAIDWHVSQIDCLCQWQFGNHYPRILNCCRGAVVYFIGPLLKLELLSLVDIPSSTCSMNQDGGKQL
jgi:hypothetical protein